MGSEPVLSRTALFVLSFFMMITLIPVTLAAQSAQIVVAENAYVDSACTQETQVVPADGSFHALVTIENTGDEDIPNSRIRLTSYDRNDPPRNLAHVWVTLQMNIDVRVGQSVDLCVEVENFYSMRPGEWRYFFFPHTSHGTGLGPGDNLFTEVENDGDYAHVHVIGIPGRTEQEVGEETSYTVEYENLGTGTFEGRSHITRYAYWDDTGSSGNYDLELGEGERISRGHTIESSENPDSRHYNYRIFHDSGQRLFTASRQIDIGGGAPILQQHGLYTNQSVYFDGDSAQISLDVRNRGEAAVSEDDYFVFSVRRINPDGSTTLIHTQTLSLEGLEAKERRLYVSDPFTVHSGGEPFSDFTVRFRPYYANGESIRCYSCGTVTYNVKSYEPHEECEPAEYGSEDMHETYTESYCADESITFIELVRDEPYRIDVVEGTMYGWSEGYNNEDIYGVFVYGEPGLQVDLVYLLPRVIELPSTSAVSIIITALFGLITIAAMRTRS